MSEATLTEETTKTTETTETTETTDTDGGIFGGDLAPEDAGATEEPTEETAPSLDEAEEPAGEPEPEAVAEETNPLKLAQEVEERESADNAEPTLDDLIAAAEKGKVSNAGFQKLKDERAELLKELEELRSRPEVPESFDPDWESKVKSAQELAADTEKIVAERDELRKKLQTLDLTLDPEFQDRYSTDAIDKRAAEIGEAMDLKEGDVLALANKKGADRWRALAKLEGPLADRLAKVLEERDKVVEERESQLQNATTAREKIAEERRRIAAQRQQEEVMQKATLMAGALDEVIRSRGQADPNLYGIEAGGEIVKDVAGVLDKGWEPTPGDLLQGLFAQRELNEYKKAVGLMAKELERVKKALGNSADPGSLLGTAPAGGSPDDVAGEDVDGGVFGG